MANFCWWYDSDRAYSEAYNKVDEFFEQLYNNADSNITGVGLTYRESQQRFATTVMEAIKDKKILLIQAGVGTGKSLGYLIPIFYTINNVTVFDKVVISTSSIALQEQLMKDIQYVSELLQIPVKAWIAKGMNNYACIRRIEDKMDSAIARKDTATIDALNQIKRTMHHDKTSDKALLPAVNNQLWRDIQVKGGCEKCANARHCAYQENLAHIANMQIVVTNHTHLTNMIKQKNTAVTGSSLLVVDEAHKLEEQVRLSNQASLNLNELMDQISFLKHKMMDYDTFSYEPQELDKLSPSFISAIVNFAIQLRSNVRYIYNREKRENISIEDCDKLTFNKDNVKIREALNVLLERFEKFNEIFKNTKPEQRAYLRQSLKFLDRCYAVLKDMSLSTESKYIYWLKFFDREKIEIVYTRKNLSEELGSVFDRNKPAILTSATMQTGKSYDYLKKSLNIDTQEGIDEEYAIPSPFNFEENTLFYYDDQMVSPKDKDRDKYVQALAIKIHELIEVTDGKALILFTSKKDMVEVYNLVKKLDDRHKLILQEGKDVNGCKKEFMDDVNSCLFATGAFWEGVDMKGKTLSNLIVARLPFPVQDPVVEYKKENIDRKEKTNVELNEMLMRLTQGTGRLIRTANDTGIVACLDPRFVGLQDAIKATLPYQTYTNDMDTVTTFASEKIIGEEGKQLKLEPKENS